MRFGGGFFMEVGLCGVDLDLGGGFVRRGES